MTLYMEKVMKLFRTSLALTLSLTALSGKAETVVKTRVLKDSTTLIALELNKKTVFCTDLGYGNVQLKINVPELDDIAHFNHRVVGEGLPCIAGGACTSELGPDNILDESKPIEIVPVRVVLSEILEIDEPSKSCMRSLVEKVQSVVRGVEFTHHRESRVAEKIEKCLKAATLSM